MDGTEETDLRHEYSSFGERVIESRHSQFEFLACLSDTIVVEAMDSIEHQIQPLSSLMGTHVHEPQKVSLQHPVSRPDLVHNKRRDVFLM